MTGIVVKLDARQLGVTDDILRRLDPLNASVLMQGLGRMIQMQTRQRLHSEEKSPAGVPWKPNHAGSSLMVRSGMLAQSIDYAAGADKVTVGSGLVYALIHQVGGTIVPKAAKALVFRIGNGIVFAKKVKIPARPYLGISRDNAQDIMRATGDFIMRKLGP